MRAMMSVDNFLDTNAAFKMSKAAGVKLPPSFLVKCNNSALDMLAYAFFITRISIISLLLASKGVITSQQLRFSAPMRLNIFLSQDFEILESQMPNGAYYNIFYFSFCWTCFT